MQGAVASYLNVIVTFTAGVRNFEADVEQVSEWMLFEMFAFGTAYLVDDGVFSHKT